MVDHQLTTTDRTRYALHRSECMSPVRGLHGKSSEWQFLAVESSILWVLNDRRVILSGSKSNELCGSINCNLRGQAVDL